MTFTGSLAIGDEGVGSAPLETFTTKSTIHPLHECIE